MFLFFRGLMNAADRDSAVGARARARSGSRRSTGPWNKIFFPSIARICCTNIDPLQTLCNWIFPTKLFQQFFNFVNGNVWNVKSRVTWLEMNLVPWCDAPFRFVLIRFFFNWFKLFEKWVNVEIIKFKWIKLNFENFKEKNFFIKIQWKFVKSKWLSFNFKWVKQNLKFWLKEKLGKLASRDLRWSRCEFLNDYSGTKCWTKVNRNVGPFIAGNCFIPTFSAKRLCAASASCHPLSVIWQVSPSWWRTISVGKSSS